MSWTAETLQEIPSSPKMVGIYKITNTKNGHFYIGKSKNIRSRWLWHIDSFRKGHGTNKYFQRVWNLYHMNSFVFDIIEMVDDVTKLGEREKFHVSELQPHYNVAIVTDDQWTITEEAKEHSRQIRLNCDPEWNRKIGDSLRGKKKSEVHTQRMRESLKGFKHTPETLEKMRIASTGKKLSEEARAKIAEKAKGNDRWKHRVFTEEAKAKIGAASKARWAAKKQQQKENMNEEA